MFYLLELKSTAYNTTWPPVLVSKSLGVRLAHMPLPGCEMWGRRVGHPKKL